MAVMVGASFGRVLQAVNLDGTLRKPHNAHRLRDWRVCKIDSLINIQYLANSRINFERVALRTTPSRIIQLSQ